MLATKFIDPRMTIVSQIFKKDISIKLQMLTPAKDLINRKRVEKAFI